MGWNVSLVLCDLSFLQPNLHFPMINQELWRNNARVCQGQNTNSSKEFRIDRTLLRSNSGNGVRLYFGGLQNHCRW